MTTGVWVLLAAVVLAVGFGCYRALTDGRFRGTRSVTVTPEAADQSALPADADAGPHSSAWDAVVDAVPEASLGERATFVQFSSAFCAPCRATRRTLAEVAGIVPGVVHLEVDAEHHLELVRRLDVRRTPTTLVLDGNGAEVTRAAGAPRKEQVLGALGGLT